MSSPVRENDGAAVGEEEKQEERPGREIMSLEYCFAYREYCLEQAREEIIQVRQTLYQRERDHFLDGGMSFIDGEAVEETIARLRLTLEEVIMRAERIFTDEQLSES